MTLKNPLSPIICLSLQTNLLCIVGELARGESMAVAAAVSEM